MQIEAGQHGLAPLPEVANEPDEEDDDGGTGAKCRQRIAATPLPHSFKRLTTGQPYGININTGGGSVQGTLATEGILPYMPTVYNGPASPMPKMEASS